MKNKKLVGIVALALMTNYVAPISTVTNHTVNKVLLSKPNKSATNELNSTNIDFYNIWGGISAQLSFNTESMKMQVVKKSGDLGSGNNNYMELSLYNAKKNTLEINQQIKDGSSDNLIDLLNNKSFNYGDIIGINFEEGTKKPNITNIGSITSNGEMDYYKITENGLVKYNPNIIINPLQILNGDKITKATITGTAIPEKKVSVTLNNEVFTGETNSKGDFNINITDNQGFTDNTKIIVSAPSKVGYVEKIIKPTLEKGININKNQIIINNVWNWNIGTISFDPYSKTIKFNEGPGEVNPYLNSKSEAFKISLYNKKGEIEGSVTANGSEYPQQKLKDLLNNKSFEYGDYIKIEKIQSSKINISNFNGKNNYNVNNIILKLTENGLEKSNIGKLPVNPVDILYPNKKVTSSIITGQIKEANQVVTANINGKTFTGKSNSKGLYSIKINDSEGFNANTSIEVNSNGYITNFVKPILSSNMKLENSDIETFNSSGTLTSKIKFNIYTNKFNVEKYSSQIGQGSSSLNFMDIKIFNSENTKLLYSQSFNGNDSTSILQNLLNDKQFNYGDKIYISYNTNVGKVYIQNNGKNISDNSNGEYFEITKRGLEKSNIIQTPVTYVNINSDTTTAVVTGKIDKPNQIITVIVDGKSFTGKSNALGNYSINITDSEGFKANTKLEVISNGYLPNNIYAIPQSSWGSNGAGLSIEGTLYAGFSQNLQLEVNTMTLNAWGDIFPAQLIDGKTGEMKANNDNQFNSENNLEGAPFKFGDIINIYESKKTYNTNGYIRLWEDGEMKLLTKLNQFQSFVITPNYGLVPVKNENLNNVSALFIGNKQVEISGKTLPNTKVKVFYANNQYKTILSDNTGEFSLKISENESKIGSEVRVFVNNENTKAIVVGYSENLKGLGNSSVNIINSEGAPVMNFNFNPVTNSVVTNVDQRSINYAGVFYGNKIDITLLNSKGNILKNITSTKQADITGFANQLNGLKYQNGDILKIQYNNKFSTINVINNKEKIGNNTGNTEYFEIVGNKGLVNITNKFIKIKPLDILGNGKVKEGKIEGVVKPNEIVKGILNGKTFSTKSNSKGYFILNIKDSQGFSIDSKILLSTNGYIPTIVEPTVNFSNILSNSYINFYQNNTKPLKLLYYQNGSWLSNLSSSIGFNTVNDTFVVNNYYDSFGVGNSTYFTLNLYNSDGNKIEGQSFDGESTASLSKFLNGKSFNYGDIIGIKYDASKYKPVILNGNNSIGNITGAEEYFEITKNGLEQVNFKDKAMASDIVWNDKNLVITSKLGVGDNNLLKDSQKKVILLNSNNKVIASGTIKTNEVNGTIVGTLTEAELAKIVTGKSYKIALQINNMNIPIYSNNNMPVSNEYLLNGSNINQLSISKIIKPVVTINTSKEISKYFNKIEKDINSISTSDVKGNYENENKILAATFINRIGTSNLETFYNKSSNNANFLNWVLNNSNAMEEFLSGPNPEEIQRPLNQTAATYTNCLQVWSNIWNTYTNSHDGFNLKLAIAIALTNGQPLIAIPAMSSETNNIKVGSPVKRYNIFENLNATGGMMQGFDSLDVSHLCYVVNSNIKNNEIIPLRSMILQNHNGLVTAQDLNNITWTINYTLKNKYTGGDIVYGPNPKIQAPWNIGGVCTEISPFAAAAQNVFGIPAIAAGQGPSHESVFYYNLVTKKWEMVYDVYGWHDTYNSDLSGWSDTLAPQGKNSPYYTVLYQAADINGLKESNIYLYLAESQSIYKDKLKAIEKAINIDQLNLGAWIALVDLYNSNSNTTLQQYNELGAKINKIFSKYPIPMKNLTHYLYKNITETYINKGKELEANNCYTAKSMEKLKIAIENAETMMKNIDTVETATEASNIIENIKIAMNDLVVSRNSLQTTISYAKEIIADGILSKENKLILEKNIKLAEVESNNKNINLSEIVKINKNLLNLINKLTAKSLNKYKLILQNEITYAEKLSINKGYTLESKMKLIPVINSAETILNNNNSTTITILEEITTLKNSLKELVVNKSQLENFINIAKPYITNSQYTLNSRNNLKVAIIAAEKIVNDPNATGIQVGDALNDIEIKYEALVTDNNPVINNKPTTNSNSVKKINSVKHINLINKNEVKLAYWQMINGEESLVINGNSNGEKSDLKKIVKDLIIENSEGKIIETIKTVPVNWYSENKNNYSGYQGIISGVNLSKLKSNQIYKIAINYNGTTKDLISSTYLQSNGQYRLNTNNNELTISKLNINNLVVNCKNVYIYNKGFVINANIDTNGEIISNYQQKELVITNSEGKIIYTNKTIPVNWYSKNKNNYSGLQAYIPENILKSLKENENYNIEIKINDENKKLIPIKSNKIEIDNNNGYNLVTKDGSLKIYKNKQNIIIASGNIKNKYIDGKNTVINIELNIPEVISNNDKAQLKIKTSNDKIIEVNGVLVNWYSKNKNNYNGIQFQLNSSIVNQYKDSYINIIIGNKTYVINLNL